MKNHLCVFFHGGLVGRASAQKQAATLIDGYAKAGAYPFFFIWNSDLLTTLGRRLSPFERNDVFRRVIEQHLRFIASKMVVALKLQEREGHPLWNIVNQPRRALPPSLATLSMQGRIVDAIWALRPRDVELAISPAERAAFENALAKDPTLQAHHHLIAPKMRFTVKMGLDILRRLIRRFRLHRDHGLYTTLVEEILHAVKVDRLLATLWTDMKSDIDDAFGAGADCGGTAFLAQLAAVPDIRLTLIGHSAGVVYVERMLVALQAFPPETKVEVVSIAGALSFDRLARSIGTFQDRVSALRLFALKDEHEGGYAEIPPVYDKSLLYFVCSLCENDNSMDKELVGMERYWKRTRIYRSANVRAIRSLIRTKPRVWSKTAAHAPPGFRAQADRHGGFAEESVTDGSVQLFIHKP